MSQLIVTIIAGLSLGGTLALIALGMVFAYRSTNTLSFTHGQLMMLSAFLIGSWQAHATMSFGWSLLLALIISAGICVLFYLFALQHMIGLPPFMGFVATLGLASIIDGYVSLNYNANEYSLHVPGLSRGSVRVFGALVESRTLILGAFTLILGAIVIIVMRFTDVGVRIRAAGQDTVLASQGGIRVRLTYAGSWAFAGVLACLAGVAYAANTLVTQSIDGVALAAVPVMLLGGFDSISGALVGGVAIGELQSVVGSYWGGQYTDVVTYVVLLVILLLKPEGLFGTKNVTRA